MRKYASCFMLACMILLVTALVLLAAASPAGATPNGYAIGNFQINNYFDGTGQAGNGFSTTANLSMSGVWGNSGFSALANGGVPPGSTSPYSGTVFMPSVNVSAWANGPDASQSNAWKGSAVDGTLLMRYWYEIHDPSGSNASIPLTYSFKFDSLSATNISGSVSSRLVFNINGAYLDTFSYSSSDPSQNSGVLGPQTASQTVSPDTWYYIEMLVGLDVWADAGSAVSASGYIEWPSIAIDPAWLQDHPGSQLEYITLAPPAPAPIPEPTTMLLLGLGLIGLAGIRRKFKN